MTIFPPSGYAPDQADGTDPQWTRWFAWFPVWLRGYGKWAWMRWVECRLSPDAPPPHDFQRMEYRVAITHRTAHVEPQKP